MDYNPLIFGRNQTQRIVSCEVKDNTIELFIENEDGTVSSEIKPNKYWILAPAQLDDGFFKLEGKLYYNWMKLYDNKSQFLEDKKSYFKRDLYTIYNTKEAAMVVFGFTYFKGLRVQDVSVLSFDIESTGLTHDDNSAIFIISNTYRNKNKITRKMFCIDEFSSQAAMIDAWCEWVRKINPSFMVGHNIFGYDIGYLDFVAKREGTSLKLGRDGSDLVFEMDHKTKSRRMSKFRKDGSQDYEYTRCYVYGRELIDTMFLAYRHDFSRKYQSYGLKQIIKQEGLEISGRQFYDAGKIGDNWQNESERTKIKSYAEQDGDDALALYDLMIPASFYLAQTIPKSFQDICYTATGSQINSFMVRSYLQVLHSIPKASEAVEYEGAISFGVPGIYKNVLKIDYAALYPSIMRQFKVYDSFKDPNGHFIEMVEYFTKERLFNKKKAKETGDSYYKDLDQMNKIFVNSAYGILGASGLNYNSPSKAAFITKKARELLSQSVLWATSKPVEDWIQLFEDKTK